MCHALPRAAAGARCLAIKVIVRIVIVTDTLTLAASGNNFATLQRRLLPLHHIVRGIHEIQIRLERS